MSAPRFFCPLPLAPGASIELPEAVARHAVRVLRLPPGARITLFDGHGGEYPAILDLIQRDRVEVIVGEHLASECESPLPVTLVQAIQSGDKMDFTIQKAVELGIGAIIPVDSRRSVVRLSGERAAKRVAHWQGIATAACEQCGRNRIPTVAATESLERWLAQPAPAGTARLMLAPGAARALPKIPRPQAVQLLIGAEGGLDPAEIAAAESVGFTALRLGPRILRTETAGLAALAAMQMLWGDLGT